MKSGDLVNFYGETPGNDSDKSSQNSDSDDELIQLFYKK